VISNICIFFQMSTKDVVGENSADYEDLFQAAENTEE
jgi:hypothetical protein